MNVTEQQVFEALGVNERDAAAPAASPPPEAAIPETGTGNTPEQPVQVPEQPAETADDTASDADTHGTGEKSDKDPMPPERRRENAARRRQEEQQAAVDKAVQETLTAERERTKTEMEAFFASANLVNTVTGAPITSLEEFNAWRNAFEATKLENELKAGKLTPESLNKAISDHPAIKRAEEIVRSREDEASRRDAEAANARIEAELAEIQRIDPAVKSMEDLLNMPSSKEFYEYVRKGNTFLDAYYLSNRERLTANAVTAAKQQTVNNALSKGHLTSTTVRGGGAVSVPSDELALFREFMPGASEADIQSYYNQHKTK